MMIRSIAGAAAAVVLLSDCSPRPKQAATDREVLQSPAAAAVLKHVLGECPRRKEVRGLTITIGEKMEQAESEFEKQFNAPDLPVFHYRRLVVGAAAGKVRIFDESTGIAPLILQISSLTAPVDGRREAVAAWSWQEEAERHRYEVVEQADGGFAVKTLEAIPVAPRNADPTSRDAKGTP
jgi:hypothetical protein